MRSDKSFPAAMAMMVAAALILAAPAVWSHGGFDSGMGYGMMQGQGMHGQGMMYGDMGAAGCATGPAMMGMPLEFSQQQREEVARIHGELRRQQWATMGKVIEQQSVLEELLYADEPDPGKVADAYTRIASLRGEMMAARVAAHNRVRGLLSEEQRAQLDEARRGAGYGSMRGGPGYGMGPGMMGPGMMGPGMMGPGM